MKTKCFPLVALLAMTTMLSAECQTAKPATSGPGHKQVPVIQGQQNQPMTEMQQDIDAMKADLEKIKSSLAQMKANLLTIRERNDMDRWRNNIDMWDAMVDHMERSLKHMESMQSGTGRPPQKENNTE